MRQGSVLTYLHGDHLGSSASLTTNASGAKVSLERYNPCGTLRLGGSPTDRQFTGQRAEASLGFYDYNARQYDPALGRFLQADTIIPQPGNPQSLNRYAYTLNNPLRFVDPTGHYGSEVHYGLTKELGLSIATNLDALVIDQGVSTRLTNGEARQIAGTIADRNNGGDFSTRTSINPLPRDEGKTVAEYWHFTSLADSESRLHAAIEAQDATAFGRALHAYQDYWAHTRNGFTFPTGQAGIERLSKLCPECNQLIPEAAVRNERASMRGHWSPDERATWADIYTQGWRDAGVNRIIDSNDILMRLGTEYWLVMFWCRRYGIDPQDYWNAYGRIKQPTVD